jgi:hypothetical protein
LDAPEPRRYEWLLHAFRPMRCEPGERRATSASGDARLDVTFLVPGELDFEQTDQFTVPYEHDAPFHVPRDPRAGTQWHFKAALPVARRAQRFLTVLHARRAGEPRLAPTLAADGLGVEISVGDRLYRIVFREAEGRELCAGGVSADGHLLAVRSGGGEGLSFVAAGARRVRLGSEELIRSDEPADCAVVVDNFGGAVAIGPNAAPIRMQLFGENEVTAIKGADDLRVEGGSVNVGPSCRPRAFEFLRDAPPREVPTALTLKFNGERLAARAERLDRQRWVAYFEPRATMVISAPPEGVKISGATVRREAGGALRIEPGSPAAVVGRLPATAELSLEGAAAAGGIRPA